MSKDSKVVGPSEYHSVSVRKIDNGYLTCTYGPKGEGHEVFSKEKPEVKLEASSVPGRRASEPREGRPKAGPLSEARSHIYRRKAR